MSATYFSFITLTSIGFGDLVPLKTFSDHKTISGQIKVVITTVYCIAGMVYSFISQKLENHTDIVILSKYYALHHPKHEPY